jgi:hypothetical protein
MAKKLQDNLQGWVEPVLIVGQSDFLVQGNKNTRIETVIYLVKN